MDEEVLIDGSVLEGGGQILRMAVSLSALLRLRIRVKNIRAGRDKPGLRPQHLKGLEVARDMCKGKLWGSRLDSTEVVFHPGQLTGGQFSADTGTAGSVSLLIQVMLPCGLFSPSPVQLHLCGGTNADMAPQIDYTVTVLKKILEKFGATFSGNIEKRGYFPRGGGIVKMSIEPVEKLLPVTMLDPGHVSRVWGRAFVAGNMNVQDAKNIAELARAQLQTSLGNIPIEIVGYKEHPHQAVGNGSGINLFAETNTGCIFGGSALGKRTLDIPEVASEASKKLLEALQSGGCVDCYAQDQIIILMALASGRSQVRCGPLTLHTKTAIFIAEFLSKVKFSVSEDTNGTNIIACDGLGKTGSATVKMDL